MLFRGLAIKNFGVFRGDYFFDLSPTKAAPLTSDNSNQLNARNLILFNGHNGAGKTTLFQAMKLALYGPGALGERITTDQYKTYLIRKIHRNPITGVISQDSSVTLFLEYVRSGRTHQIQIERSWRINFEQLRFTPLSDSSQDTETTKVGQLELSPQITEQGIEENLSILEDNQALRIEASDYQAWINELLPLGLASVCFFDAEQLEELSNIDYHSQLLKTTLYKLFGLDLVQKLYSDLDYYISKQGGSGKIDELQAALANNQLEIDELAARVEIAREEIETYEKTQHDLDSDIVENENRLVSEGGTYSLRRPIWQERLKIVQREIENTSNQLRELANELLPFTISPNLCQQLRERLLTELEFQRSQIAQNLWEQRIPDIQETLFNKDHNFWDDITLSNKSKKLLANRFIELLQEIRITGEINNFNLIHPVSEPDRDKLLHWITQVLDSIPREIQKVGKQLKDLIEEQNILQLALQRAPDDALLAPIHAAILTLQQEKSDLDKQLAKLREQLGSLEFQQAEKIRVLQKVADELTAIQTVENQIRLAERNKLALRTYKDALTRQKLLSLEQTTVKIFNQLCQKEYLLANVQINPSDFSVQLQDRQGNYFNLSSFSAGERQLYIMALLWAMREVSGRELPLIIDTPLARLDENHRANLLQNYFPVIGKQVVLFTTNAELNTELILMCDSYTAHLCYLNYNPEEGQATINQSSNILFVSTPENRKPESITFSLKPVNKNGHGLDIKNRNGSI